VIAARTTCSKHLILIVKVLTSLMCRLLLVMLVGEALLNLIHL
jgi:hypothetical protein